MGEKIQEFRKDIRRRMNGMGSGNFRSIISKRTPEKGLERIDPLRPYSIGSLDATPIPSISVIHESWIPTAHPSRPLRITNSTPPTDHISILQATPSPLIGPLPSMHSPLASPLAPTIEIVTATEESTEAEGTEDTPTNRSFGSSTSVEDSPLTSQEIALIERPLSSRFSLQARLENREKPIMTCDIVPVSGSSVRFSKKDLMRPLPPSPPLSQSSNENELIQSLRHELVVKTRKLKEERERLEETIAEIRYHHEQFSQVQSSSRYSDNGSISSNLTTRLQYIEFESNRLKVENEILCKRADDKEKLQHEVESLKKQNDELNSELGHMQDLNKRIIHLENENFIASLEQEMGEVKGLGINNSPVSDGMPSYAALQEQMADVQAQLLESAAEQRADWDLEREQLAERIRILEESELRTVQELEKERHRRCYFEQEFLRAESSYNVLSESLKQQKSRFQGQIKAIETKLMAIESASEIGIALQDNFDQMMISQKGLIDGHKNLFHLQGHYMQALEKIQVEMNTLPKRSQTQRYQVQDALSTLRQFLPPVKEGNC